MSKRRMYLCRVGLSMLALATLLAGCATTPVQQQGVQTQSVEFSIGPGDRAVIDFDVPATGRIVAEARWTGSASSLALILNGPGQVGFYQRMDGPSPNSVSQAVSDEILARGTAWRITIALFDNSTSAKGTLKVTFPVAAMAASAAGDQVVLWQVGSPHTGETPLRNLPANLRSAAASLGKSLQMETYPAKDFDKVFASALASNTEPDILVIDNYGILQGIKTDLGNFTGIWTLPNVKDSLVLVSESLKYQSGWEFLVRSSKHFEAAKALALRPPDAGSILSPGDPVATQELRDEAQAVTRALCVADASSLRSHYLGGFSNDTTLTSASETDARLMDPVLTSAWGNANLAVVSTLIPYEGYRSLGYQRYMLVFARPGGDWKLLVASSAWSFPTVLKQQLPDLKGRQGLTALEITAPTEGSVFEKRFPESERPDVTWKSTGPNTVLYLVEFQYGWASTWAPSFFVALKAAPGTPLYKTQAAGVGAQPHRFRVWAIDGAGSYELSGWTNYSYKS